MAEYVKTGDDIIEYFEDIEKNFAHPFDVKYVFITNNTSKKLIKVNKLSDQLNFLLNAHVLVTINETFFDNFEDDTKVILINQELDKIECNAENGQVKINSNPLISTSSGIIEKYTLESVKNANELERQYLSQLKEKEKEENKSKNKGKKNFNKK